MGRGHVMLVLAESNKIVNLVKSETDVIHTAQDFFNACKDHLQTKEKEDGPCLHFLQTFHLTNKLPTRPNTGKWTSVPDT